MRETKCIDKKVIKLINQNLIEQQEEPLTILSIELIFMFQDNLIYPPSKKLQIIPNFQKHLEENRITQLQLTKQ